MKKYIISDLTGYDEDENLYFTKVGMEGKNMPLHYTVWGITKEASREKAVVLVDILTNYRSSQNSTTHPL